MQFTRNALTLNPAAETERIVEFIQKNVRQTMRRSGGVVGISGGIDSAVVLALAVRAFGAAKVVGVMMPDKDSDPISEKLARELAAKFGVQPHLENITGALEGFDCYRRRDDAVRRGFPANGVAAGSQARNG